MIRMHSNTEILEQAVSLLEELTEQVVFVGGCSTGMLITDPAAPAVRVTLDVDVITNVDKLSDYYLLQEKLRDKGFKEDTGSDVICRYKNGTLILDVIPTDATVLGFGNEWLKPAYRSAEPVQLPSGKRVKMISGPYFLACKFSAFKGRGNGDYISPDIEDIISVIDGRPEIIPEVRSADSKLKRYLINSFKEILKDRDFHDTLPGILPGDQASQARIPMVLSRLLTIAELSVKQGS
jgi:hypothetical protein